MSAVALTKTKLASLRKLFLCELHDADALDLRLGGELGVALVADHNARILRALF